MLRQSETQMKESLTDLLEHWWDESVQCGNLISEVPPYIGPNVLENAANSALQVILAVADTENFLKEEGIFSDGD